MTPDQLGAEAERRKVDAHALLAARRDVLIRRGRRALLTALCGRGVATADDVRAAVSLPPGVNPVCLGTVPGPLAAAGIIEADGFAKSTRPESHARPVQRWRLVDRAAALAWLRDHPNRPDPAPEPAPQAEAFLFPDIDAPDGGNRRA